MQVAIKDKITVDVLTKTLKKKGYVVFENGDYNLNIVGIRNDKNITDRFDDLICVFYKVDGKWKLHKWPITTDPGLSNAVKPINIKGAAILKPGQHRSSWKIGLHKGQYKALVQCKSLPVYRDNNKDNVLDYVNVDEGIFGINIHRSSATGSSTIVGNWSAGCQVFQVITDYEEFMKLVKTSANKYTDVFTYTLIETNDLIF